MVLIQRKGGHGPRNPTLFMQRVATWDDLSNIQGGKLDAVFLDGYASVNDGGEGEFDLIYDPAGTYIDDGGTVSRADDYAVVRRGRSRGLWYASWFGMFPSASADASPKLQSIANAVQTGYEVRFRRGVYKYDTPVIMLKGGVFWTGEGVLDPNPGPNNTTFQANMPVASGTSATIASAVTPSSGDLDTVIATITGLSGLAPFEPGDEIWLWNCATEQNNGVFTLLTVGETSVTAFGYNNYIHNTTWRYLMSATDANNGSIRWEIRKPLIKLYTRDNSFRNIYFHGANKSGTLIDSTVGGSHGTPAVSYVNTNNQFRNCRGRYAFNGAKIGDISGCVAGGASAVTWMGNCDLHVFENCAFSNMIHAPIHIPNPTSNSMLHSIINCSWQYSDIGICIRRGSFIAWNPNFTRNKCDILIGGVSGVSHIYGGSSEHSAKFLVLGASGYRGVSTHAFPIVIDGFRGGVAANDLAADKCYIESSSNGGLSLRSCNFGSVPADWTVGISGYSGVANPRQIFMTAENCVFPSTNPESVVTAKASAAGLFPVWWQSVGNTVLQGTNVPMKVPDGVLIAKSSPTTSPAAPSYQVLQLVTPAGAITLSNGDNNAIANPYRTSVVATGPTAPTAINGILAGTHGQRLRMRLDYNYQTTLGHLVAAVADGNRVMTSTAADVVLAAPGASPAYNLVEYEYDKDADSGKGAWVVQ